MSKLCCYSIEQILSKLKSNLIDVGYMGDHREICLVKEKLEESIFWMEKLLKKAEFEEDLRSSKEDNG